VPFAPTTLSNKLRYPLLRCTWQELARRGHFVLLAYWVAEVSVSDIRVSKRPAPRYGFRKFMPNASFVPSVDRLELEASSQHREEDQ
jgi:hypothetical protein